jgi:hypothetical protein
MGADDYDNVIKCPFLESAEDLRAWPSHHLIFSGPPSKNPRKQAHNIGIRAILYGVPSCSIALEERLFSVELLAITIRL